jgi:hypothetical protein
MAKRISSIDEILAVLPAVQKAVRTEIKARIDAGEQIGTMDDSEMRERSRLVLERARAERTPKKSAA